MYSKILIPLDGSRTAEKVLPYARYLARKFRIPVELLAVIDIAEIATHMAAEKARFLDAMIEEGVKYSTSYLRGVATTFPNTEVKCEVERGKADEVIIERGTADTKMLIAMATHGRSGLNRFLLGSVAEKVLRGSSSPLLLVRAAEEGKAEGETRIDSVIVPLDGSELAERVIAPVVEISKALDIEVVLFRTYSIPYNTYAGDDAFMVNNDKLIAGLRDETDEYLEKKVAEIKKLGVAKVSAVSKEGLAGDEIIAVGKKTPDNLIAMGSHGRSGVRRFVLGSVTETVVRHSNEPVLVIRAGGKIRS